MNKQKIPYEVPEAQTFVVKTEGVICTSTNEKVKSKVIWDYEDEWD